MHLSISDALVDLVMHLSISDALVDYALVD